jgi:probable F420-dependent oxidoreductase
VTKPFRFITPLPILEPPMGAWGDRLRRIEDLGFSAVSVSDHLVGGWSMEPFTALAAAAGASSRLRLMTLVVNSDIRHPAQLHKAAATVDRASEGRLELGLGAGWLAHEYAALGIPFADATERVSRLAETIQVLKRLFAGERVVFRGTHHALDGLEGAPAPVQRPHPPFLLAGGSRSIIGLAGREADIAGIAPVFRADGRAEDRLDQLRPEAVERKLSWLRDAAAAVGRDPGTIELQLNPVTGVLGTLAPRTEGWMRDLEGAILADQDLVRTSPYVLAGSAEQWTDHLLEIRDRFGFSCIRLPGDPEAMGPIVKRLAGQ